MTRDYRNYVKIFLVLLIAFLTLATRLGGLTTDWNQGIPDWHPDSGRYFAQEKNYIHHDYSPIAQHPLYTGNPYGNILILSWIWHGINKSASLMGYNTPIGMDPLTLSKIGRSFYIFLSILLSLLLFFLSERLFKSLTTAFFSAFFFSVSPLAIGLTHTIKPEVPLTFFLTLSAAFVILISQTRKIAYYVFAGVFAGIATAVKYNGSIVLLFLFLVHTYKVFNSYQEETFAKKILHTFISPSLFLSVILWATFFYAFEPILWHNWKEGLRYINGYLHVAALVGTPRGILANPLKVLWFNMAHIPGNLWLFIKCGPPFIIILSITGPILSNRRKLAVVIASFPALILFALFLTKSLFGEEYLLHPLPFVYVLAAVGCQSILKILRSSKLRQTIIQLVFVVFIAYGLFIGFREAKYACFGNIRYYATQWALKNIRGNCIRKMHYTLFPKYHFCSQKPSIFVVPSPATIKCHYRLPKSFLIKTFQFEKDKPLLHHLRGHQIRFFAYKGKDFPEIPHVPHIPIPLFQAQERRIIRFLNGIDFNPGYRKFFLTPETHYHFVLVSPRLLSTIPVLLENFYVTNKIDIAGKKLKLLPFEKKLVTLHLHRSFPWSSPYIYELNVRPEYGLLLSLVSPSLKTSSNNLIPDNKFIEEFAKRKLTKNSDNFWPFKRGAFEETFKSIFHYDFKFIKNLLVETVPPGSIKRINMSTDFYHKRHKNDYCLFSKNPVLLGKGYYNFYATFHLCLADPAKVTFKIITPSQLLAKKTITRDTLITLRHAKRCMDTYHLLIPFRVDSSGLTYLLVETEGQPNIKIENISFETDIKTVLRKKIETAIAMDISEKKIEPRLNLIKKLDPALFDFRHGLGVANFLYENHFFKSALNWYSALLHKNPLSKLCVSRILQLSRDQVDFAQQACANTLYRNLLRLKYGPWKFETNFELNAISIPESISKSRLVPFTLYLNLPNISGDQAVALTLKRKNFRFGKAISLLKAQKAGELFKLKGEIIIPENAPSGQYELYFSLLIPKIDYYYRHFKKGKISDKPEVKVEKVTINP